MVCFNGAESENYFIMVELPDQDICYLTGGGIWDSTNHFTPVGMGSVIVAVLGDIQIVTVGGAQ